MIKNILKGFQFGLGFILALVLLFGVIYAVGFHSAAEILGGTFQGEYIFNGSVNITGDLKSVGGIKVGSATICDSTTNGTIRYNSTEKSLEVCNGNTWLIAAKNYRESCKDIYDNNESFGNGTYWIKPSGSSDYQVYCDMSDGGWTLIFSSQTVGGRADVGGEYSSYLTSLTPTGSMLSVWTPFSSVSSIRFSCDGGKDGSIDYSGYDNSNEIYSEIKSCTTGYCQSSIGMDSGQTYGNNNDGASDPDFWIVESGSWGTYDDYPYNTLSNDDLCANTAYRSFSGSYPVENSTGGAYFYIWVK